MAHIDLNHGLVNALQRIQPSSSFPVSLSINCGQAIQGEGQYSDGTISPGPTREHDIYELIKDSLPRIRSLKIVHPMYSYMKQIILPAMSTSGPAPLLEELVLVAEDAARRIEKDERFLEETDEDGPTLFQGHAPRLRQLTLRGVVIDWDSAFLQRLDRLELAYQPPLARPAFRQFRQILKRSKRLHTLVLDGSGVCGELSDWMEELGLTMEDSPLKLWVDLPLLKKLHLGCVDEDDEKEVVELLMNIGTDRLRHLSVAARGGSTHFLNRLEHALEFNKLRTFSVAGFRDNQWVIETLLAMPNVEELTVDARDMSREWYRNLRSPPLARFEGSMGHARGMFLQKLRALTTRGVPGRALCQIVRDRKAAGMPLARMCVKERDPVKPNRMEWLRENVAKFERYSAGDEDSSELGQDPDSDVESVRTVYDEDEEWDSEDEESDDSDSEESEQES